jgi:hypothetical protein
MIAKIVGSIVAWFLAHPQVVSAVRIAIAQEVAKRENERRAKEALRETARPLYMDSGFPYPPPPDPRR